MEAVRLYAFVVAVVIFCAVGTTEGRVSIEKPFTHIGQAREKPIIVFHLSQRVKQPLGDALAMSSTFDRRKRPGSRQIIGDNIINHQRKPDKVLGENVQTLVFENHNRRKDAQNDFFVGHSPIIDNFGVNSRGENHNFTRPTPQREITFHSNLEESSPSKQDNTIGHSEKRTKPFISHSVDPDKRFHHRNPQRRNSIHHKDIHTLLHDSSSPGALTKQVTPSGSPMQKIRDVGEQVKDSPFRHHVRDGKNVGAADKKTPKNDTARVVTKLGESDKPSKIKLPQVIDTGDIEPEKLLSSGIVMRLKRDVNEPSDIVKIDNERSNGSDTNENVKTGRSSNSNNSKKNFEKNDIPNNDISFTDIPGGNDITTERTEPSKTPTPSPYSPSGVLFPNIDINKGLWSMQADQDTSRINQNTKPVIKTTTVPPADKKSNQDHNLLTNQNPDSNTGSNLSATASSLSNDNVKEGYDIVSASNVTPTPESEPTENGVVSTIQPEPVPEPEPEPEPEAEPTQEPEPNLQTTATPESQNTPSNEPVSEPKAETGESREEPTQEPSKEPTKEPPSGEPKSEPPSAEPKSEPPSAEPKSEPPSTEPHSEPPSEEPTGEPKIGGVKETVNEPTGEPESEPTTKSVPQYGPTNMPQSEPTTESNSEPKGEPNSEPTGEPKGEPNSEPKGEPNSEPNGEPKGEPTGEPNGEPKGEPKGEPNSEPKGEPNSEPEPKDSVTKSEPESEPEQRDGSPEPTSEPGPEWEKAKKIWQFAWEAHIYAYGGLFAAVGFYTLLSLLRLWNIQRLLSKPYFFSLNLLILLMCATRSFYMLYDGYNSHGTFPISVDYFLYSIPFPCLTSAFSILLYALLKATHMQLVSPAVQRLPVMAFIVIFHFIISIATDFLLGMYAGMQVLLFVCQMYFIIWGLFLFFGYAHIFRKIYSHAVKRQKNLIYQTNSDMSMSTTKSTSTKSKGRFTLSTAVKVTFFTAICGLITVGLEIYAIVGVYKTFTRGRPKPWPWWLYHTVLRLIEFLMCLTMSYVASQPFRYKAKESKCSCGILCVPCAEILCCGQKINREGSIAGWSEVEFQNRYGSKLSPFKNGTHGSFNTGSTHHLFMDERTDSIRMVGRQSLRTSPPTSVIAIENDYVRFQADQSQKTEAEPQYTEVSDTKDKDIHNMNTFRIRDGLVNTGYINDQKKFQSDMIDSKLAASSSKSSLASAEFFHAQSSLSLANSMNNEIEKAFESFRIDSSNEDDTDSRSFDLTLASSLPEMKETDLLSVDSIPAINEEMDSQNKMTEERPSDFYSQQNESNAYRVKDLVRRVKSSEVECDYSLLDSTEQQKLCRSYSENEKQRKLSNSIKYSSLAGFKPSDLNGVSSEDTMLINNTHAQTSPHLQTKDMNSDEIDV